MKWMNTINLNFITKFCMVFKNENELPYFLDLDWIVLILVTSMILLCKPYVYEPLGIPMIALKRIAIA